MIAPSASVTIRLNRRGPVLAPRTARAAPPDEPAVAPKLSSHVVRETAAARRPGWALMPLAAWLIMVALSYQVAAAGPSLAGQIDAVQPKIVKIYGAGGIRRLEAYQSGFLVSDEGHVLTIWSYVLDTDEVTVTLNDGRKFTAEVLGADPRLEIALLKIDAAGLDHFRLDEAVLIDAGSPVLAFSNLYGVATGDEPASVLHGTVSVVTQLQARRGVYETPYRGRVYVLDAMTNNPGAGGGALTDRNGRLAAILGKELRNSLTNTWLNYAIPIAELTDSIDALRAGQMPRAPEEELKDKPAEPLSPALLGLVLLPDVLPKTPPFIERVRPGSPAAQAGLRRGDLVLFVGKQMVQSCKSLVRELGRIDRDDSVRLTVLRNQELIDQELSTRD